MSQRNAMEEVWEVLVFRKGSVQEITTSNAVEILLYIKVPAFK
jgi:hypothetical protein